MAQCHAIDAGAEDCIDRGAFLFAFFMDRNRGYCTGFGVKDDQMAGVGEMCFGGRLKAIGFPGWNAEFHGFSSGFD
jgi:hypothetical protein